MDREGRDPEFFLEGIRQIGKLYDYDTSEPFDYAEFDQILQELDPKFKIRVKAEEV